MIRSILPWLAAPLLLLMVSACGHMATHTRENSSYVGAWKLKDTKNTTFYIRLNGDGTAKSTWGKDETGRWELENGSAKVTWSSGWTDVLSRDGQLYTKSGYRPGSSLTGPPADRGPAERVSKIPGE